MCIYIMACYSAIKRDVIFLGDENVLKLDKGDGGTLSECTK